MSQNTYYYRTRLLELLRDKKFSHMTQEVVMTCFQDILSNKKEDIALHMYELMEKCETDNDVIKTAYGVVKNLSEHDRVGRIPCEQRYKLIEVLEQKAFSPIVRQKIMCQLMESPCVTEREVEKLASKYIPLVRKCQTEDRAIDAVQKLIEQEVDYIFNA